MASGSVGQVHKGKLSVRGAEICGMSGVQAGKVVAVKVKHPGVSLSIQRDFGLMMWAANLLEWNPMMRKMRLQESLSQFAAPLREQVRALIPEISVSRSSRTCVRSVDPKSTVFVHQF